ncbi:hypothetical protein [Thermoactinomyces sp. DSM 45892]|uniref:hypothetical protein n=1 Tax=Thermoactinomyces sp. DSM 45892 TaxID=1882753 RepID=UPI000897C211|nr:hypothetical protein [Thermoactinomyces sp. DSM 45892]SDY71363.1 hypothetical protein SAMN05444416_107152 [Thermoactinomyces sp. DSM 45892]
MEQNIRDLVVKTISVYEEETIKHFRFILHEYPYHPDTKFILLELQGHSGDFGIAVSAMADWGAQLFTNAYGDSDSALGGFDISSMSQYPNEITQSLDFLEEISFQTKKYIPFFLQECFNEAGGKESRFPFYLRYNNGDVYDFMAEEFPDYIEGLDA